MLILLLRCARGHPISTSLLLLCLGGVALLIWRGFVVFFVLWNSLSLSSSSISLAAVLICRASVTYLCFLLFNLLLADIGKRQVQTLCPASLLDLSIPRHSVSGSPLSTNIFSNMFTRLPSESDYQAVNQSSGTRYAGKFALEHTLELHSLFTLVSRHASRFCSLGRMISRQLDRLISCKDETNRMIFAFTSI